MQHCPLLSPFYILQMPLRPILLPELRNSANFYFGSVPRPIQYLDPIKKVGRGLYTQLVCMSPHEILRLCHVLQSSPHTVCLRALVCWVCSWHIKLCTEEYLKTQLGLFTDVYLIRFLLAFVVPTKTNPKLYVHIYISMYIHRALDSLCLQVLRTASMIIIIALFLHTGILA